MLRSLNPIEVVGITTKKKEEEGELVCASIKVKAIIWNNGPYSV